MLREGAVNQTLPSFPVWDPHQLGHPVHGSAHRHPRRDPLAGGGRAGAGASTASTGGPTTPSASGTPWSGAGMTSVAVHYPAAHPSGVEKGFVVDGFRPPQPPAPPTSRWPPARPTPPRRSWPPRSRWTTTARPCAGPRAASEPVPPLKPAQGWRNLPDSHAPPLERSHRGGGPPRRRRDPAFHLLAVDGAGRGYDRGAGLPRKGRGEPNRGGADRRVERVGGGGVRHRRRPAAGPRCASS